MTSHTLTHSPTRLAEHYKSDHNLNSDAFTRREAAQENVYIHEKEVEKYVHSNWLSMAMSTRLTMDA